MTRAILLGPLGASPALARELSTLDIDGPVALITAGWEEGERNDAEVDRWLGGGTRNLGLYGRRLDVLASDGEYAAGERALRARLAELREVYLLRLRHALAGADAIRRRFAGSRRHAGNELDRQPKAPGNRRGIGGWPRIAVGCTVGMLLAEPFAGAAQRARQVRQWRWHDADHDRQSRRQGLAGRHGRDVLHGQLPLPFHRR